MKYLINILMLFYGTLFGYSQVSINEVNLWQGEIPNSIENLTYREVKVFQDAILTKTSQVKNTTLSIFVPEKANGIAIVIFPGGGYKHLSMYKEGFKVAKWLNTLGITAFVLKYRLPSNKIMKETYNGPLQDAQEAMRYVRRNKEKWHLKEDKIGVMGFSAGGHLASTLSTQYKNDIYRVTDDVSSKPDFSILIYPVISMKNSITHKGSKKNLLGNKPSKKLINKFSNELHVNKETPKTFLVHATDDKSVPVENSINYYFALKKNNVPVELHLYERGGHGFGLGREDNNQFWLTQCEQWLRLNSYLD